MAILREVGLDHARVTSPGKLIGGPHPILFRVSLANSAFVIPVTPCFILRRLPATDTQD